MTDRYSSTLNIGKFKIAYSREGSGPDVLFVHGWPLHSRTYRSIVALLKEHYTCHLFDLPGAGASLDNPLDGVTFESYVDVLAEVVEQLGLKDYAMVGQDSGGAMARLVAARHGERVRALVLANTEIPGHHPWQVDMYIALAKSVLGMPLFRATLKVDALRRSILGFGGCFSDKRKIEGEFHDLFVAPLTQSKAALRGQLSMMRTFGPDSLAGLEQAHAQLKAPALLIWGAEGIYFPIGRARRMLPQFGGGAELRAIENAKLLVYEEHPAEFVRHAHGFLQRCFGGEAAAAAA